MSSRPKGKARKSQYANSSSKKVNDARKRKKKTTVSSGRYLPKPPRSIGSEIGSWIGHGAQKLIKNITGFGDYSVETNSILQGGITPPDIVNTITKGGFIVRHREYICDIPASVDFSNQSFDINPGLHGSFPYLSQIAKAFELYRMRGMVFEFKSMSSDAVLSTSSSSALGTVAMATQYNALSNPFTNLIALQNHEYSNAAKPSVDFYHPVECKKSLVSVSELYVRTGEVESNADIRLYDLGQFNIATVGMQNATGIIGQLWCTYEVEFHQAKYDAPTSVLTTKAQCSGCSNTAWFGLTPSVVAGSSLGLTIGSNILTFPTSIRDGKYLLHMKIVPTGGSAAMVLPTITPDNCTLDDVWCAAAGFDNNSQSGTPSMTGVAYTIGAWITINAASAKLTFSGGTLATSNTDIVMTQVDADIST